jgi:hypothetical protein
MSTTIAAPPLETPIVEPPGKGQAPTWTITKVWANWLRSLIDRTQAAAAAVGRIVLAGQVASIGLSSLVPLASGLYRVTYRFRVSTAASVSSSLLVTITATDGGVTVTQSSPAYTGNVTNQPQSGVIVMRCDPSTPLRYSTTYASVGTPMAYALDLQVEAL